MKIYGGEISEIELEFVKKKFGMPMAARPAPTTKWKGKIKIHPHVTQFIMDSRYIVSVFNEMPIYYEGLDRKWHPLSNITSYFGNKKGMILLPGWENKMSFEYLVWYMKRQEAIGGKGIGLEYPIEYGNKKIDSFTIALALNPTTTFNPQAGSGGGNVSVDGFGRRTNAGATFADIHDGVGTDANDVGNSSAVRIVSDATVNTWNNMIRNRCSFDTSSLGATANISAATYSLNSNGKTDNFALAISLVKCTPGANNAVVASDYNIANWGATKFATDITIAAWNPAAYNDFTVNGTGITDINKTGVTNWGNRLDKDVANVSPTWVANTTGDVAVLMADFGQPTAPKLAVTTSVGAAGSFLTLMGVG